MAARVRWEYDTLTPNLQRLPEEIEKEAYRRLEAFVGRLVTFMRDNASWQDQTGDARRGLNAEAYRSFRQLGIVFYHSVDYGIWLEIRWSGRYAILIPTLEQMGPELMQSLEGLLEEMSFV